MLLAGYGLLGGTFDPIHLGHLAVAEAARETFALDRIVFMPAGNPPHKPGAVVAAAPERLRMAEMAVADNPYFVVSRLELEREGPSYTVDTVARLRAEAGGIDWHLIVGGDTLEEIPTWHDFRTLLDAVVVLAASRPGCSLVLPPALSPWRERIKLFQPPAMAISSSMIRARLLEGGSIRYLVPDCVAAYIEARGLYGRTLPV